MPDRPRALAILGVCFALSGATALMYEVVWLRMLGLVLGHTAHAITTVLVAFIGGLGLGSMLFGRWSARLRNPIRVYGLLEIGVGVLGAITPALMHLAAFMYPSLHHLLASSYGAFSFVQFVLALAVLLPPTILMGGTLPVLSQALARREDDVGRTVGTLYAVNTFGAVAGVVLAGYGLLPAFGNRATLWTAVGANLVVGAIVIAWSRGREPAPDEDPPGASALLAAPPWRVDADARLVAAALGVSGGVAMLYEVAWTRALTLVVGSSTFAFTAMLVAFLLGIAWGAAVYSALWGRRRASPASFATIQVGIAVAILLVALFFERLPVLFLLALERSLSPRFVELLQVLVSAHALLPPALLIGATFPCAAAACVREPGRVGEDVGWLYAVNTGGAVIGAALAGFWLIPSVGVQESIKVGVLANLAMAVALALLPRPITFGRFAIAVAAVIAAAGTLAAPRWDPRVMASAPAVYGKHYVELATGLDEALRTYEVLFHRDGPSATVAVTRSDQHLSLRVNGKVEASTDAPDMPNQLLSGHLPLLLHPGPRAVLLIGLGSGITAAAVARHPIEGLDVLEIEPAVVEASEFFAGEHGNVLEDARVRLVLADGRNFLMTTPDRYDVIISEPSNPWIGGVATLFTREFFLLARERLRPGGIMVQWLQAYNLVPADVRMVVRTFQSAFPATSLWHSGGSDLLLVGRMNPAAIDLDRLRSRYEENAAMRGDLRRIGHLGWSGTLGHFLLGEADVTRCVAGAPLNTDDRLSLEFSAPRALYLDTRAENMAWIDACRIAELPEVTPGTRPLLDRPDVRHGIGIAMLARGARSGALRYLVPGGGAGARPPEPTR